MKRRVPSILEIAQTAGVGFHIFHIIFWTSGLSEQIAPKSSLLYSGFDIILATILILNKGEGDNMNYNCQYETSCERCKHKCKDYIVYREDIESERLLQGNDRQPMKREHGALTRKWWMKKSSLHGFQRFHLKFFINLQKSKVTVWSQQLIVFKSVPCSWTGTASSSCSRSSS